MNFSAVIFWTLGALAVGTAQGQLNESVDSPLTVEDRLQLLLDDHLIESADGLDFELHSPRQAERVLSFEQPWERPTADYVTVFKDGENNTGFTTPAIPMVIAARVSIPVTWRAPMALAGANRAWAFSSSKGQGTTISSGVELPRTISPLS